MCLLIKYIFELRKRWFPWTWFWPFIVIRRGITARTQKWNCENKCSASPHEIFKIASKGRGRSPNIFLLDTNLLPPEKRSRGEYNFLRFNPFHLDMLNDFIPVEWRVQCFHNMQNMRMIITSKQFFDRLFKILLVSKKMIFFSRKHIFALSNEILDL